MMITLDCSRQCLAHIAPRGASLGRLAAEAAAPAWLPAAARRPRMGVVRRAALVAATAVTLARRYY
jgi:hypothetical protein